MPPFPILPPFASSTRPRGAVGSPSSSSDPATVSSLSVLRALSRLGIAATAAPRARVGDGRFRCPYYWRGVQVCTDWREGSGPSMMRCTCTGVAYSHG
eukprot:COSAG01_NODE_382_length_17840_cov_68.658663_25_plen_98_part_00